jgi:hypothetical protein
LPRAPHLREWFERGTTTPQHQLVLERPKSHPPRRRGKINPEKPGTYLANAKGDRLYNRTILGRLYDLFEKGSIKRPTAVNYAIMYTLNECVFVRPYKPVEVLRPHDSLFIDPVRERNHPVIRYIESEFDHRNPSRSLRKLYEGYPSDDLYPKLSNLQQRFINDKLQRRDKLISKSPHIARARNYFLNMFRKELSPTGKTVEYTTRP